MRKIRSLMIVLLVVTVMLVVAACGGDDDDSGSAKQSTSTVSIALTATATTESTDPTPSVTEEATEPNASTDPTNATPGALTFEEAQALTDFELVMPDPIPSSLEFVGVTVSQPPAPPPPPGTPAPVGTEALGSPTKVQLSFQPTSGTEQPVNLTESSNDLEMGSSAEGETLNIDGTEVTKFTRDDPSGTLLIYLWEAQDLHFMMNAIVGPDLPITEEDLEQLIAGTLG